MQGSGEKYYGHAGIFLEFRSTVGPWFRVEKHNPVHPVHFC
jgi:hypothetical protein